MDTTNPPTDRPTDVPRARGAGGAQHSRARCKLTALLTLRRLLAGSPSTIWRKGLREHAAPRVVLSADRAPNTNANSEQHLPPACSETSRGKEELSSRRTRKEKGEGTSKTASPAGGVVSRSGSEHKCKQQATAFHLLHQNQSRERGAVLKQTARNLFPPHAPKPVAGKRSCPHAVPERRRGKAL